MDTAIAGVRSAGSQHLQSLSDLEPLFEWAATFSERTRSTLAALLLDPPQLDLALNWPGGWVDGDALVWSAFVPGSSDTNSSVSTP